MAQANVVGVDPGLVHTGVVQLRMESSTREWWVRHEIVAGPKPQEIIDFLNAQPPPGMPINDIYIEGYRTRGQYNTNSRMITAVAEMKAALPVSTVVPNMGIKRVVKPELLKLMQLSKFPTTHHQDLQSAARILVLGMLKNPAHNRIISKFVKDHLDGHIWTPYVS